MSIIFEEHPMTDTEYKRELAAFTEHAAEFGNPPDKDELFGFVATDDGNYIGSSSGLAQKFEHGYGRYFYLSDLMVEKPYRKHGYGKKLLKLLEDKARSLGIENIWTWTASYEASTFYLKQGYEIFVEFQNFYPSGHAKVGLIKNLYQNS